MSAAEMAKYFGKIASWAPVGGIHFAVEIIDARLSWGTLQLRIRPENGYGSKWVNKESLVLAPHPRWYRKESLVIESIGS